MNKLLQSTNLKWQNEINFDTLQVTFRTTVVENRRVSGHFGKEILAFF